MGFCLRSDSESPLKCGPLSFFLISILLCINLSQFIPVKSGYLQTLFKPYTRDGNMLFIATETFSF